MQRILQFFSQRATTLFFPMALILYDFAAYLTTDLIQPGIINVVRDFNADVSLAPAIWRAEWRYNGFWGRYLTGLAADQCC